MDMTTVITVKSPLQGWVCPHSSQTHRECSAHKAVQAHREAPLSRPALIARQPHSTIPQAVVSRCLGQQARTDMDGPHLSPEACDGLLHLQDEVSEVICP